MVQRLIWPPTSWFVHQLVTYRIFFLSLLEWFSSLARKRKICGPWCAGKPTWRSAASTAPCSSFLWSAWVCSAKHFWFPRTIASLASVKFSDQWSSKIQNAAGSDLFLTAGSLDTRSSVRTWGRTQGHDLLWKCNGDSRAQSTQVPGAGRLLPQVSDSGTRLEQRKENVSSSLLKPESMKMCFSALLRLQRFVRELCSHVKTRNPVKLPSETWGDRLRKCW